MAQSPLQQKINNLKNLGSLKNASISIDFVDLETGSSIASLNKNVALSPASSLKLLTTAIALNDLGADFKYKTTIGYNGKIIDSTLIGDVVIFGTGDPSLGQNENALNPPLLWAQSITDIGIEKIEGNIIADASYFDTNSTPPFWPWIDLGNYYASGVWGINIYENSYQLFLDQTKQDQAPEICGTKPNIDNLKFINELNSAEPLSGDNAYIFGAPYTYNRFVRGTIPSGKSTFIIKGSMPEAPLQTAQLLKNSLNKKGVYVDGNAIVSYSKIEFENEISELQSAKLLDLVKVCNVESKNLYAESFLKTLGKNFNNDPSFKGGIKYLRQGLSKMGLNQKEVFIYDGSGLSPNNAISSSHFTKILTYIYNDKNFFELFKSSLAIAGKSGTASKFLRNTQAQGNVYLKTGSMEAVKSYTGYIKTKKNKYICFSIILNKYTSYKKEVIDNIQKIILEAWSSN